LKIVSLLPSATELVYALGLGDHLSGVTFECDYPPQAREKPVVSDTALPTDRPLSAREIDAEVGKRMDAREPIYVLDKDLIRQIQPDIILTQDLCRVCAVPTGQVQDALDELGSDAEVVSLDPHNLEDILESFIAVGRATGAEDRAKRLVEELRERIDAVKRTAARLPTIRTLCLEWIDPPFVGGHWIPEMVGIAGGRDVLGQAGAPSYPTSWEVVRSEHPELVVVAPCGFDHERAAREATLPPLTCRAVAVDSNAYYARPAPRLADGVAQLAFLIHPDLVDDPGLPYVELATPTPPAPAILDDVAR
jgi:iron complex transport system substrate-binding protein